MEPLRLLEYAFLLFTLAGLALSLVVLITSFGDAVAVAVTGLNGERRIIAQSALRGGALAFIAQIAFFYVAVSFVTSPIPSPLPIGTGERVSLVTVGAIALLLQSLDQFVSTRRLLRK